MDVSVTVEGVRMIAAEFTWSSDPLGGPREVLVCVNHDFPTAQGSPDAADASFEVGLRGGEALMWLHYHRR